MTYCDGIGQFLVGVVGSDTAPSSTVVPLRESAVLLTPSRGHLLREDSSALTPRTGGIWLAKLISADVQGSSGYYPAAVLRRDGPRVFPAGTHVYMDHPGRFAEEDLPERSVRDLAGALMEDARFEQGPDGPGLYALVQFFADYAEVIAQRARHIGMSIRAQGLREMDTETGRAVITRLLHADSVDIVTRPGAGGRLIEQITPDPG